MLQQVRDRPLLFRSAEAPQGQGQPPSAVLGLGATAPHKAYSRVSKEWSERHSQALGLPASQVVVPLRGRVAIELPQAPPELPSLDARSVQMWSLQQFGRGQTIRPPSPDIAADIADRAKALATPGFAAPGSHRAGFRLRWEELKSAAEAGEAGRFDAICRQIDWSSRSPEDFIRAIKLALLAGAFMTARRLSEKGVERFPDHQLIRRYAELEAPAKVIRSNLPAEPEMGLNMDWLKRNRTRHRSKWVAVKNGILAGEADSLEALVELVGPIKGVRGLLVTYIL